MNVNCKRVSEKDIRDAMLVQIITHICDRHGCKAKIDFDAYTIDIDGPESVKEAIITDLDQYFG